MYKEEREKFWKNVGVLEFRYRRRAQFIFIMTGGNRDVEILSAKIYRRLASKTGEMLELIKLL